MRVSRPTSPREDADLPEPSPAADEIVVRVHASSVKPVDVFIGMGALAEMFEHEFPVILGRDFAGVVEQVGDEVGRYRLGDEVFGFVSHANPTVHAGSWAELIVLPEDNFVAAKPDGVDAAAAGAAPVAALNAIAAFDALAPAAGEDVLVIGATGGVGAPLRAAGRLSGREGDRTGPARGRVLPPRSRSQRDPRPQRRPRRRTPRGTPRRGRRPLRRRLASIRCLRAQGGGRLASPLGAAGDGEGRFNVMAVPSPTNLQRLGELLAANTLRIPIERSYTLERVGEALQALPSSHTQGKLGVTIT